MNQHIVTKLVRICLIQLSFLLLIGSMGVNPLMASAANEVSAGYRLLIYYGIPEYVNDVNDVNKAADIFSEYDYIVFGDKLQFPENTHYESTKEIIAKIHEKKPDAVIFGYVDLGITTDNLSIDEIKKRSSQWKEMGANGVFLDDAGYDYKVSRARLNTVVDYVHSLGMPVFINAWRPEEVMGSAVHATYNPKGLRTKLGNKDYYLLESLLRPTDISDPSSGFRKKMDKVMMYRKYLGVKMMSISVMDYEKYSENSVRKFFRMNEAAAAIFSLDGYGIAPVNYSSAKNGQDVVRRQPYIANYKDYYTTNVTYVAKSNDRDYASQGFRLYSVPGKHFYIYPDSVVY